MIYALIDSKSNTVMNIVDIEVFSEDLIKEIMMIFQSDKYVVVREDEVAYIGGKFVENFFYPPKPFDDWIWNTSSQMWQPPMPEGEEGDIFVWDDSIMNWVKDGA